MRSTTQYPTATFDLVVDGKVEDTVTEGSRGEATRALRDLRPEFSGLAYQGRALIVVREHEHAPAAGNTSVCVFCQERIPVPLAVRANQVSRFLREAGFNPLGSGTSRNREGIRVSGTVLGGAMVSVDLDSDNAARRTADDVQELLEGAGYTVKRASNAIVNVTGRVA